MLTDMPVREEIREFLFKVWAEVLARGRRQERPAARGDAGAEEVGHPTWSGRPAPSPTATSAPRSSRTCRELLQRLRQGMTLLGIEGERAGSAHQGHRRHAGRCLPVQDRGHPARRGSRPWPSGWPTWKTSSPTDPATDLPLDAQSIEMMLGIDASMIEVVADGGSQPSAGMLAWAGELQLGNWFALDHNGAITQVQYAWRSDRKQLHLFAAPGGRSYLIQAAPPGGLPAGRPAAAGRRRSAHRAGHARCAGQAGRESRNGCCSEASKCQGRASGALPLALSAP